MSREVTLPNYCWWIIFEYLSSSMAIDYFRCVRTIARLRLVSPALRAAVSSWEDQCFAVRIGWFIHDGHEFDLIIKNHGTSGQQTLKEVDRLMSFRCPDQSCYIPKGLFAVYRRPISRRKSKSAQCVHDDKWLERVHSKLWDSLYTWRETGTIRYGRKFIALLAGMHKLRNAAGIDYLIQQHRKIVGF